MDFRKNIQDVREMLYRKRDMAKRKWEERKRGRDAARGPEAEEGVKVQSAYFEGEEMAQSKENGRNDGTKGKDSREFMAQNKESRQGNNNQNKRNDWKSSRILQVILVGVLCISTVTATFTSVGLGKQIEKVNELRSDGIISGGSFMESREFSETFSTYMELLELQIELAKTVAPDGGNINMDMVFLESAEDGKGITLRELYDQGQNRYDYSAYVRNYLNNLLQYSQEGISLLHLTEGIRSLRSMVVVQDGSAFYTPQSSESVSSQEKKKIKSKAATMPAKRIYQGNEVALPNIIDDQSTQTAKEFTLQSVTVSAVPQNMYQSWLFENYPKYAEAYMKTVFADAFDHGFETQEDGLDYKQYKKDFMQDYMETFYLGKSDDFYLSKLNNEGDSYKFLCAYGENGEEIVYEDDYVFYRKNGDTVTAEDLKRYLKDEIYYLDNVKLYSTSQEDYAGMLRMNGQWEMQKMSDSNKPWQAEVVACSIEMAQDYARFLVDCYNVLGEALRSSQFAYHFETEEMVLQGRTPWSSRLNQLQAGTLSGETGTDDTDFFYACYDSSGSIYQTNFSSTTLLETGIEVYLKQVGVEFSPDASYTCAVGVDMEQVRLDRGSDSKMLSQIYQQFQERQLEYQEIWNSIYAVCTGLVVILCVMALSLLLLLVKCGHQKGQDAIVLLRHDRIWPELLLLVGAFAGFHILVWMLGLFDDAYFPSYQPGWMQEVKISAWMREFGLPVMMAAFLLVADLVLVLLVKRIKAGKLLSDSLIYKFLLLLKKFGGRTVKDVRRLKGYLGEMPALRRYLLVLAVNVVVGGIGLWLVCEVGIFYYGLEWQEYALICLAGIMLFALDVACVFRSLKNALADERIRQGAMRLAQGELSHKIGAIRGISKEQAGLIETINHIGDGLERAVEDSIRSERMKTELITNVSHDIKTPLTSVINYIDLLKKEQIDNERVGEYLEILDAKSQRLKVLIEDLVEASKASSGALELQITQLNFNELVHQTNGEFEEKFEQAGLTLIADFPQETVRFKGDGKRVYRVLENLYGNVAKYAMAGTRVYAQLYQDGDRAVFTIKNISRDQLNITPEELTERFVRGEQSRTTEGSGLGLSIAKNLTELMQGEFLISLDGDLFRVTVSFPVTSA